ncbi:MAG: 3-deoxy-8-phosphooctulonate synthase [Capsulimonadales bacterium]|nr:3-deoxy-8-phosphooctulonate synthase [Capsulimonadales bacterium]
MSNTKTVEISQSVVVGGGRPFALIAGPCVIESRDLCREVAASAKAACDALGIPYIFKASFDKANRTSVTSFRGHPMAEGLEILAGIREEFGIPALTDVHDPAQCAPVAEAVDILQIPAFLSRQTDLLLAAGETGRAVNIKKGQFLAPWDMRNVAAKVASTGNEKILLCERGASFGYNTLVVDFRGLPQMAETGYPVVFDGTHSVQQPGGQGTSSGGQREFVPHLSRAAVAVGIDALFLEVHPEPEKALSDAATMLPLAGLPDLLATLKAIDAAVRL